MSNSGRATRKQEKLCKSFSCRKRGATEVDSTTTSTFRPGQVVAVEAAAFGNLDEISQDAVKKADEFGRVVSRCVCCGKSRNGVRKGGTNSSLISTTTRDVL